MANETQTRPPVVVVLGHVDHGKSSLLEAIREDLRITSKESGGITQHIGAYQAEYQGRLITFLDTPGHEAFSAMRSRGAKVADIGILVVAADEGVKPQTKEAIVAAKEAELSLIVALNKIDKPGADPQRLINELASEGVLAESLGGTVPFVQTSATTKQGIKELLETIVLVAQVADLKTDYRKEAHGVVIEVAKGARTGIQATLLVKEGVLRTHMVVATKTAVAKIRSMQGFKGEVLSEAFPATPVLVMGFESSPLVGEEWNIFFSKEAAIEAFEQETVKTPQVSDRFIEKEEGIHTLKFVLKADVLGSLEALEQMLSRIKTEEGKILFVKTEVGDVTENDVKFARSVGASILGFRVRTPSAIQTLAQREHVQIDLFDVIYALAEHTRTLLEAKVRKHGREDVGALRVLAVFGKEKGRQVVGGKVVEGEAQHRTQFDVQRANEVIGQGRVVNLQREKKDTSRIPEGEEGGVMAESSVDILQGDILRFFRQEKAQ